MGDAIRETGGLLCGLVVLIGLGAALTAPAAAQRHFPRTWTLVPPADRSDAPPLVPIPELAAGDREYALIMSLRADATGTDRAARDRATTEMMGALVRAAAAYRRDATTPALLTAALTRLGDLYDAVADVCANQAFIPDAETERRIRGARPEVRREVMEELSRRVHVGLASTYQEYWCGAYEHYRDAAAIRPPDPRAVLQLRAYGPELARVCEQHGD